MHTTVFFLLKKIEINESFMPNKTKHKILYNAISISEINSSKIRSKWIKLHQVFLYSFSR